MQQLAGRLLLCLRCGMAIVILPLLVACASSSVFNPYPTQAANYLTAIAQGDIDSVTAQLYRRQKGKDGLLYAQESGRLHQLNGQFAASRDDFEFVFQKYREQDEAARLTVSGSGAQASALFTNDNAIPYRGYGYERIMAIHFQMLNYLALGDIEAAGVELRRAALEQRILEQAHARAINEAHEQVQQNRIDLASLQDKPELAGMNRMAGQVKSSFLNAYTFYTSAVIRESMGDLNGALVDYRKALEINPDNATILEDIRRVDGEKSIGDAAHGHLLVLFEDGFVSEKSAFHLSLPYFTRINGEYRSTYLNVSFPYYSAHHQHQPRPLRVYSSDGLLGSTGMIADINAMAVRALQEEIPAMVVRMVLRARAKHELHRQGSEQGGILGSLLATIYNIVSEQADRRSWLTLPHNAQLLRQEMPVGSHRLELTAGAGSRSVNVEVKPGKVTLLRVINANNRLIIQQFQL